MRKTHEDLFYVTFLASWYGNRIAKNWLETEWDRHARPLYLQFCRDYGVGLEGEDKLPLCLPLSPEAEKLFTELVIWLASEHGIFRILLESSDYLPLALPAASDGHNGYAGATKSRPFYFCLPSEVFLFDEAS